ERRSTAAPLEGCVHRPGKKGCHLKPRDVARRIVGRRARSRRDAQAKDLQYERTEHIGRHVRKGAANSRKLFGETSDQNPNAARPNTKETTTRRDRRHKPSAARSLRTLRACCWCRRR